MDGFMLYDKYMENATMQCKHPLGFATLRNGEVTCFDCGTPTPGRCVCGALFRTMHCMSRGHMKGPTLVVEQGEN
ncbi:hypothetical protein D7252_08890 [Microbacterium sp. CGR2]|nr:hypothetical protein D7252_08890 [Microbacterium sp. CGR2]